MKLQKRVTLIEDNLGGGNGRMYVNLSHEMTELGVQVDIVLRRLKGPYIAKLNPRVRVVPVATLNRWSGVPAMVRHLWSKKPAALILPSERLAAIALAARRFVAVKPRIIACVFGIDTAWLPGSVSRKNRKRLARTRRHYSRCDAVVCLADGLRARFIQEFEFPAERVHTIRVPAVTEALVRASEQSCDHPWFQPGERPVILNVARLEPPKDLPTLIRAFAELRRKRPCRLMILGEGKLREELQALALALGVEGDLALPGEVANPFVFMRRAAVFALSSRYESGPFVLVEALALGSTVVAADCPYGPAEILEHGRYGGLTPVGDVSAMADAIERALRERADPALVSQAVRRFEARDIAQQYLALCGIEIATSGAQR